MASLDLQLVDPSATTASGSEAGQPERDERRAGCAFWRRGAADRSPTLGLNA